MALRWPFRVKHTTTTTGGPATPYTLSSSTPPNGYRRLADALAAGDIANGDEVSYLCIDTTLNASGFFEVGRGVYNSASNQVSRVTIYQPGGVGVTWGSGTRDFLVVDNPLVFAVLTNNLSDLASLTTARANLGLLPAGEVPSGQSGPADGLIVRPSAANTWVAASNANTAAQLHSLFVKIGGVYYPTGSVVNGLGTLVAGSVYYLSTGGAMTTTPPTPSGSLRHVLLGVALSTTHLLFTPQTPIGG